MVRVRPKKEKVGNIWLGIAGTIRRYCLVDFHDLVYYCYLCDYSLFNKFCTVMCYSGCYCCNHNWMPPLGFITDNITLPFYVQYCLHFQRYKSRRFCPVPIICWVATEKSLGKFVRVIMGFKNKK